MIKPVIIEFPDPDEVSESYRTDILVSQIVELTPPFVNRFEQECRLIKQYPYDVFNDGNEDSFEMMLEESYYFHPIENYDVNSFDQEQTDSLSEDWFSNMKLQDMYFERFIKKRSVGCEHYICGALLRCEECLEFFGCRHCHNEQVSDHEFPKNKTTTMKCRYCGDEEPFSLVCRSCERQLGIITCDVCKFMCFIDQNSKPFFHCSKCHNCECGFKSEYKHCDTCERCILLTEYSNHVCSEHCPICLESISNSYESYVTLRCGHVIHSNCRFNVEKAGETSCPLCRKTLFSEIELEEVRPEIERAVATERLSSMHIGDIIATLHRCNDCGVEFYDGNFESSCSLCNTYNCHIVKQIDEIGKDEKVNLKTVTPAYYLEEFDVFIATFTTNVDQFKTDCEFDPSLLLDFNFREALGDCETENNLVQLIEKYRTH